MCLALTLWMVLYVDIFFIFIYAIIVHESYSTITGVYTGIFRYNGASRMSYSNTARLHLLVIMGTMTRWAVVSFYPHPRAPYGCISHQGAGEVDGRVVQ